jgi:membrane protein YqaA with SNARE-associated domain
MRLGVLGLFAVSVIDSSPVPLPIPGTTDLLLLWLVSHNGNPWLLALSAIAGSLLGGILSWNIGRKGGEIALRRYISARLLARVVAWVQKRPILAVFLPAVLPPPIPLSPFVLAAGALGVPRNRFLAAFGAARTLRYGLIAWLGAVYGRGVVRVWSNELEKWSTPLLVVFFTLLAGSVGFAVWKLRSHRDAGRGTTRVAESAAARSN